MTELPNKLPLTYWSIHPSDFSYLYIYINSYIDTYIPLYIVPPDLF